jgi:hypothetical protein
MTDVRRDDWLEEAALAHTDELGAQAHELLSAAISEIASALTDDERALVEVPLPSRSTTQALRASEGIVSALVERVAQATGLGLGRAHELLSIAGELLGERIAEKARARLLRDLPRDLAELLEPVARNGHGVGHTLLRARRRPRTTISESPPGGHRPLYAGQEDSDRLLSTRPAEPSAAPVRRDR